MAGHVLCVSTLEAALNIGQVLDEQDPPPDEVHIDHDGFLFDLICRHHERPDFVLPDRADISPGTHCLRSFSTCVEAACRERGIRVTGDVLTAPAADGRAVVAADLLLVPKGRITERGIRENIRRYLDGDGAAARLAWAQLWQWVHMPTGVLDEGRIVTPELFRRLLEEEVGAAGTPTAAVAGEQLAEIVLSESFTMPAL